MMRKSKKSSAKAGETLFARGYREADLRDIKVGVGHVNTIFHNWLDKNSPRFNYPVIQRKRISKNAPRHGKRYKFDGICQDLYFTVAPDTCMVHFDLRGKYYDGMCDFEIYPAISTKGKFVCALCAKNYADKRGPNRKKGPFSFVAKRPKYCDTLDELYADHCFERLLIWTRKNLQTNRIIVYVGDPDGSRMAQLRPMRDVLRFTDAPMGDIVIITAVSRILRKNGDRHLSFFIILTQILRCEAV
jgi:hypothetical protein